MKEKGGGKAVQAGPNKETAESILGSPQDWADATAGKCLGLIPIPCEMLAIAVGAIVILLVVLR